MQYSSSASTLALGKDLGKPRSLVSKGSWQSRSSPALAAAFSLRQYAVEKKHIVGERPSSAIVIPIEKIDLLGGNGKWRQLRAQEEFQRRQLEEEERHRQEAIREQEKKRRQAELADRRRRHQEEEERRWQQEREQKLHEKQEKERLKREAEERLQQQREEEELERVKRMPKPCETCAGGGLCQECMGKGFILSTFLVPKVTGKDLMDHGRKLQGCDKCGGYCHNLIGDLKKGSGNCAACGGTGKIWPVVDDAKSPPAYRSTQAWAERQGEVRLT